MKTIPTATATAIALAAGLTLTAPALAADATDTSGNGGSEINRTMKSPEKVIPEEENAQSLNQPWQPGISSGPGADPENVATQTEPSEAEKQQANAPATSDILMGDATWDQREDYTRAVEDQVGQWQTRVDGLDDDTVTKDHFRDLVEEMQTAADDLANAGEEDWEQAREDFQAAGSVLREEYAELPQQRKSDVLDEDG